MHLQRASRGYLIAVGIKDLGFQFNTVFVDSQNRSMLVLWRYEMNQRCYGQLWDIMAANRDGNHFILEVKTGTSNRKPHLTTDAHSTNLGLLSGAVVLWSASKALDRQDLRVLLSRGKWVLWWVGPTRGFVPEYFSVHFCKRPDLMACIFWRFFRCFTSARILWIRNLWGDALV